MLYRLVVFTLCLLVAKVGSAVEWEEMTDQQIGLAYAECAGVILHVNSVLHATGDKKNSDLATKKGLEALTSASYFIDKNEVVTAFDREIERLKARPETENITEAQNYVAMTWEAEICLFMMEERKELIRKKMKESKARHE